MKRQIITFFILMGALIWSIRVINLNREKGEDTRYMEMGQEFYYGDIAIQAEQFLILSAQEYEAQFGVEGDVEEENRAACLKFHVRNESDQDVLWDDLFSVMGIGFECKGWCSVYDPFMGAKLNTFYTETFEAGSEVEFWLVTTVSRICFREKTWEKLPDMEFEYVMSMYPGAVRIRLVSERSDL